MEAKVRLIIAGGRDFKNYILLKKRVSALCTRLFKEGGTIEIVCGKAPGADTLGERFAKERGFTVKEFPAEWDRYKRAAGPIRNTEMAEYATHLIAFWDGNSPGTNNMIAQAKKRGLGIRVVKYGSWSRK